jgi:mannosyltransferase
MTFLNRRLSMSKITDIMNLPWMIYVWLFVITLIAAVLRFYKLGEWSFWIDEIFTLNRAINSYSNFDQFLANIPPTRYWFPVSVILTAQAYNLFGQNEWSARLVSTVIGILTIPILYIPISKIFGKNVALIALLLLAIAPWHIFWSQNARFYTSLMLYYSLALFVFYFGLEKDRPSYFIAFYILFYLAMSERMLAVFLFPVIFVYLFLLWVLNISRPPGFRNRNILILITPLLLFIIFQLFLLFTTGAYLFAPDVEALAPPIDSPIRLLTIIIFSIGISIFCLGFFSGLQLTLRKHRAGLLVFIGAVLPPVILAIANPFIFTVERYAFLSYAFWIILAAIAIKTIFLTMGKKGFIFALSIIAIVLTDMGGENLMYYQINRGNRLDWRETVDFVKKNKNRDDIIISTRFQLASYYLKESVLDFETIQPEELGKIDKPIWFIMDIPGIYHGRGDSLQWIQNRAALLQYSYLRVREQNSLLLYRFDPNQKTIP